MSETRTLIVIDMQNDFIYGPLGTEAARAIVPNVKKKIEEYKERGDRIIFTQDTHFSSIYHRTHEGMRLPVEHCVWNSDGWNICKDLPIDRTRMRRIYKQGFGYTDWQSIDILGKIEIIGVCTDICVVSNALILRSIHPETDITVDASCCAGTTPEMHKAALAVMKSCHIDIVNE